MVLPLFGVLGTKMSYGLFPFFVRLLRLIMIFIVILLYKKTGTREGQ